jgi:hypothetical protein
MELALKIIARILSYCLYGTDPDQDRALEITPGVELIPCRRKPLRCTLTLRDPTQKQV